MLGWFRRFTKRPLRGAPAIPRRKSYPALSGYVYQYVYAGRRQVGLWGRAGVEHVFSILGCGQRGLAVSVFLGEKAVRAWEHAHGRVLSQTERYAVAKISLFEAFDQCPGPEALPERIRVRAADLEGVLDRLGLS